MRNALTPYAEVVRGTQTLRRIGRVSRLGGLSVEAHGLQATVGEFCSIARASGMEGSVLAEVVGVKGEYTSLMPYGAVDGLATGCDVVAAGSQSKIAVGM